MKRKRMKLLVVEDNDGGTGKLQEDALTIESVVCMDKPKTRCYLAKHHKAMTHVDCWFVTFSFLHARITTCIHHVWRGHAKCKTYAHPAKNYLTFEAKYKGVQSLALGTEVIEAVDGVVQELHGCVPMRPRPHDFFVWYDWYERMKIGILALSYSAPPETSV